MNAASGTSVSLSGLTGLANLALTLTGAGGAETLAGSTSADRIDGAGGSDTLIGGAGDDSFVYASTAEAAAGETVDGVSGVDEIVIAGTTDLSAIAISNIDTIDVLSGDVTLTGAQITGQAWSLFGAGLNTATVNAASGDNITLASLAAVSGVTLRLNGAGGAETLTGSVGADSLNGLAGNDSLTGGAGADTLSGGADDDTFVYAGTGEAAAGETVDGVSGFDTVRLTASTDLSAVAFSNIDAFSLADGTTATLTGQQVSGRTWSVNGVAGGGTETLVVNVASGTSASLAALPAVGAVAIQVNGAAGAETLTGSLAADRITGGAGADSLTGGGGADTFVFAAGDSGVTLPTADVIADFVGGTDLLGLGLAGDAAAGTGNYVEAGAAVADFSAALAAANAALASLDGTSAASRLYAFEFDGTNGYLFIDTDSDGDADQVVILTGVTDAGLSAGDIIA